MAPKQRMRIANEKATKNITLRGNVPKSSLKELWSEGSFLYNVKHQLQEIKRRFFTSRSLAVSTLHLRSLWIGYFSNNPEHQAGVGDYRN